MNRLRNWTLQVSSTVVVDLYQPPSPPIPPVLVVDDHSANRWILGRLLHRLGIDSRFASDGTEAVALAGMRRWGAFLIDIEMPRLDGDIAAKRMRRLSAFLADVPIIAVTSLPANEAWSRCRKAGINGVLFKPVTLHALENELHQHAPALFQRPKGSAEDLGANRFGDAAQERMSGNHCSARGRKFIDGNNGASSRRADAC